jgi:hypothetical protein
MEELNNSTFVNYCIKNYDNPQCSTLEEFEEDCKRFFYLKKLFSKYRESKQLRDRLILNHLIVLYNVFGTAACTRLLFFKLNDYYSYLAPFLIALNRLPDEVKGINGRTIITSDIPLDTEIIKVLRERSRNS